MGMRRVVLDTNVLVSAALWAHSAPAQALDLAVRRAQWVVSDAVLDELQVVLMRPKFERWAGVAERRLFLDWVRARAQRHTVLPEHLATAQGVCRDPADSMFLALALAADARLIVSGDADLLTLHPWRGISICTAAAFVQSDTPTGER